MNAGGAVDENRGTTSDTGGHLGDDRSELRCPLRVGWLTVVEWAPDPGQASMPNGFADLLRTLSIGEEGHHVRDAECLQAGQVFALRAMGQRERSAADR